MLANASPLLPLSGVESTLGAVLAALAAHDDKAMLIEFEGRRVQAGYHVTEVKAGSFKTLDCGGNPDAWQETVLQIEDIPAQPGESAMTVGKFRSILARVDGKVRLDASSRLTLEVSRPAAPMQVFDIADITVSDATAIIRLAARPAICKPRHRAEQAEAKTCCTPKPTASATACCA